MIRAVTFVPGNPPSREVPDLTYTESVSRNRSIHVLLQDFSTSGTASRGRFLQNAYRDIISSYMTVGKLEHPLAFFRQLIRGLDALSRSVDSRVEDFAEVGLYVVVQDGNTLYVLTGKEGQCALRTATGFVSFASAGLENVRSLPLETASSQQELFSRTMRDFLSFSSVDIVGSSVELLLGGSGVGAEAVRDAIAQPGAMGSASSDGLVTMEDIPSKVLFLAFDRVEGRPDRFELLSEPVRSARATFPRGVAVAGAAALMVAAATWWAADRITSPGAPQEEAVSASQERSPVLTPGVAPAENRVAEASQPSEVASVDDDDATAVTMSLAWSHTYTQPVTTTPLIDGETVLFGARDGKLYAYGSADGSDRWQYAAKDGIGASPVIAGDAVVVADYSGTVACLNLKDGAAIWTSTLPAKVVATPCVAGGEVLVGCMDGNAYSLSLETGRRLWKVATAGRIRAPIAGSKEQFYVASYDGKVYAVSQGSGVVRWSAEVGGNLNSAPAADDARVIAGGDRGIVALDAATGKRLWDFKTPGPVHAAVLMANGRIYVGSNDGNVYCLDAASGVEVWRVATGDAVLSRPELTDSCLLVTSYDGYAYCVDPGTGDVLDRYNTGGAIFSSPAVSGGRVYFGNNQGKFYCLNFLGKRTS